MPNSRSFLSLLAPALAVASSLAAATPAPAYEETVTTGQVEAARRCAIETRVASRAFRDVNDAVQMGEKNRARTLLESAEDALASARRACVSDYEVLADLDALEREADGLRRSLPAAAR